MKKAACILAIAVLTSVPFAQRAAWADTLTVSLSNPEASAIPGSTLTFDATVEAPLSNTASIYLNSDSFTLTGPLTLDDSDFYLFPLSLTPGSSFAGPLFTVTLPADVSPDAYLGSFEILGGANDSALDPLATVDFTVNAISATPEPNSLLLLATGVGALVFVVAAKRRFVSDQPTR